MAKGGGLLELLSLLAARIPGASRAKGGIGTGFDWLRKAVTPSIEPFRQARYPVGSPKAFIKQNPLQIRSKKSKKRQRGMGGQHGPYTRGADAWEDKSGFVRREGRGGAAAIDPGDPRILYAMLARPRNLAKLGGAAGLGLGGYALMSSEEDLPEEVAQVVEEQDRAVVENITGEEDIGKTPSWLRPLLTGLGAYAGYKRSGLMGGLVGGAGGYGISELLKKNPGMYDWIKDNPELATMLGFLGADALRGGGGGSSDIPSYQPYSPLTYESLGGYAPSTEMPQMAQGGVVGGMADILRRQFPSSYPNEPILDRIRYGVRNFGNPHMPEEIREMLRSDPNRLLDDPSNRLARDWRDYDDPQLYRDLLPTPKAIEDMPLAPPMAPSEAAYFAPGGVPVHKMAQGGIAGGGSSGLNGLRTGLRDAIVNSIDDPNRQGVNSFVPSMLKAYDEIPKLQAGGISGGANPGFVDPGKQAVQQQQSQPGYAQSKTGDYGQSGYGQMSYGTDPYRSKQGMLSKIVDRAAGSSRNLDAQAFNAKWGGSQFATGGPGPGPGHGPGVSSATTNGAGAGAVPGTVSGTVPGIGSGYDPMTSAIGQNILEQRAAMGGLGSNMTDISLARGMAPHMAGLQNQWFNQQMGMEGFNQRERENMARFGLQAAALENQKGYTPYTNQYFRAGGVG